MTWRWRICSSVVALALATAPGRAVTVAGSVRLTDSRDPGVRKHRDYSGVVVWLEPVSPVKAAAHAPAPARMEQRGKRFIPHVLAIQAGASVEFPNFDPIFHNAFSSYSGQIFDLGLYAPGTSRTIAFTRAGIVRVFCNIHPSMSAVIAVLRHPWFEVTRASGAFAIEDVPAGEYTLHVFHERASAGTLDALATRVTVSGRDVALRAISISETGYVEAPHQNKFGHDYPPAAEESGGYAGGHR
jgi:plastocyanin